MLNMNTSTSEVEEAETHPWINEKPSVFTAATIAPAWGSFTPYFSMYVRTSRLSTAALINFGLKITSARS